MKDFNKYQFIDNLKEDIKEEVKTGGLTNADDITNYIYDEVDRVCIYYTDCFQIIIELNAFDFQGCRNVSELANLVLTDFIYDELPDFTTLLKEIEEELKQRILNIKELKNI